MLKECRALIIAGGTMQPVSYFKSTKDKQSPSLCLIILKHALCRFQTSSRSCCFLLEWERNASWSFPVVSGPFSNTAALCEVSLLVSLWRTLSLSLCFLESFAEISDEKYNAKFKMILKLCLVDYIYATWRIILCGLDILIRSCTVTLYWRGLGSGMRKHERTKNFFHHTFWENKSKCWEKRRNVENVKLTF